MTLDVKFIEFYAKYHKLLGYIAALARVSIFDFEQHDYLKLQMERQNEEVGSIRRYLINTYGIDGFNNGVREAELIFNQP